MEPIDIVRLEEAVVIFYRSTCQEQAHLHEWLTKVHLSAQAWQFSWQLTQLGKSQEAQCFGAITLHSKLMKFWHEVPAENRDGLKQKIPQCII
uniref:Importin N-terminal domain-containing protein n=1 Tax=Glossina pallidipes TaxID=7398 RepID=A0A1A9ZQ88_GLOPL